MSREMKHSCIEWIGDIPAGWEICQIRRVMRNRSERNQPNAEVLSLYRDWGIVPKKSRDDNHNVTSEDTTNYKVVHKGDFVINKMKAWQGSMAVSDYDGIISPAYYVCNFVNNHIYKRYIHHLLRNESYKTEYMRLSSGLRVGQWDLNIESFLRIPMVLPPLSEQQKIADYLDKVCGEIDGLVALQEAMIDELKAYKQSVITEAVTRGLNPNVPLKPSGIDWIGDIPEGWEVKPFKVLFRTGKGLSFTKSDLVEKGISVISYGQIHSKQNRGTGIISSLIRCIPEDIVQGCNSSKVSVGDFIFADTSEDLSGCGNCVYVDKDINLYAGYHSVTAISKRKVSNIYLAYLFLTDCWRSQIRGRVSGIKVYSISQSIINQTSVILPPEGEQQQIANYLDTKCSEIDSLIAFKQQKIEELKEYKKSVIYEYVTGKKEVV